MEELTGQHVEVAKKFWEVMGFEAVGRSGRLMFYVVMRSESM
jgi:hypothetical protein